MPYDVVTNYNSLSDARTNMAKDINRSRGVDSLTPAEIPIKPLTTTMDVREEDQNTVILQQNILYAVATLTATTFLFTAIILAND